jgi:hypothetical protein
LDALLLFPPFAVAATITRSFYLDISPVRPVIVQYLLAALITATFGSVFAAPITLCTQVVVRKRRTGLSAGEWVWLGPLAISAFYGPGDVALSAAIFPRNPEGIRVPGGDFRDGFLRLVGGIVFPALGKY